MRLKLLSDYREFYDAHFDLDGERTFYRQASEGHGFSKREQFSKLKDLGWRIPIVGPVASIAPVFPHNHLVVYDSEFLHAGEGKRLLPSLQALAECHPYTLCSMFIPTTKETPREKCVSLKFLYIGNHKFFFRIHSSREWRTNCGRPIVELLDYKPGKNDFMPLYSIDVVENVWTHRAYAVDLNTAPGLSGLRVDEKMSGKEIVDAIKEWMQEREEKAFKYFYYDYTEYDAIWRSR